MLDIVIFFASEVMFISILNASASHQGEKLHRAILRRVIHSFTIYEFVLCRFSTSHPIQHKCPENNLPFWLVISQLIRYLAMNTGRSLSAKAPGT